MVAVSTIFERDSDDLSSSAITDTYRFSDRNNVYALQITNELDEDVTVSSYRTYVDDDSLTDAVSAPSKTVSSGDNSSITLVVGGWEAYGLEIDPAANPSSGTLTIREHTR